MAKLTTGEFSSLLRAERKSLVGFLTMLTGDRSVADDLFQECVLEIWRTRDRFQPGTNFGAWARAVARIQVLRHFRWQKKRRAVPLSPEVMEQLAQTWEEEPPVREGDPHEQALKRCVEELEPDQRRALECKYNHSWTHARIAQETGRSEDGVKMMFLRLRKKLRECVEAKLREKA
jgi:RNA polymerase sigma-70 factor (ECF subfamily)